MAKSINIQVTENFKYYDKEKRNEEIKSCIIKHFVRSIKSP